MKYKINGIIDTEATQPELVMLDIEEAINEYGSDYEVVALEVVKLEEENEDKG